MSGDMTWMDVLKTIVATLSYLLVERPVLSLKGRVPGRRPARTAAT